MGAGKTTRTDLLPSAPSLADDLALSASDASSSSDAGGVSFETDRPRTVTVRLRERHEHAGRIYEPGALLTLDPERAARLIARGTAE